jgi:CubicO group peptidase (beta-lactamase class C family)
MFSYSNAGFSLAGRVVEKLTGGTWDAAIETRLAGPLQLGQTVTRPDETPRPRAAVGHYSRPGHDPTPVPNGRLPRSWGPAATITAGVDDLLTFAGLHLRGGTTAHGRRLLSESSTATMRQHHIDLPASGDTADSWGLGWARMNWDGTWLIGHDGATIGQTAYLRLLPAQGLALALLTNASDTAAFSQDLIGEVFTEFSGIRVPPPPEPPGGAPPRDAAAHVGTYRRTGELVEVTRHETGHLVLTSTRTDGFERFSGVRTAQFDLEHVRAGVFAARPSGHPPGAGSRQPVAFCRTPAGRRYVYRRLRTMPMITEDAVG